MKMTLAIIAAMLSTTAHAEPIIDKIDSRQTRAEATELYRTESKRMDRAADFGFHFQYGDRKNQFAKVYVNFKDKSPNSPIDFVAVSNSFGDDVEQIISSLTEKMGKPTNRSDVSQYEVVAMFGSRMRQDDIMTTVDWATDTMIVQLTASGNSGAWQVRYRVKQKLNL